MASDSEKNFLIEAKKRHFNLRKVSIAVLIAIVATLCIVLAFVLTGRHQRDKTGKKLGDILPESFSAEFSVRKGTDPGTDKDTEITIEWNRKKGKPRLRETDINQERALREIMAASNLSTTFKLDHYINITIVNDDAVLNVFDANSGNWTWYCIPSSGSILFYQVIQYAPNATESAADNMVECHGNVWSVGNCNGCSPIYFCENNSSIVSIKQGNMTAVVSKWTVPTTKSIRLPENDVSCKNISFRFHNTKSNTIRRIGVTKKKGNAKYQVVGSNKVCLFVHGVGMEGPTTGYYVDYSQDYWKDIKSHVSRCTEVKFIRFDTINRGWDNHDLHQSFCEFAAKPDGNLTISNKIIYAHSMGNLIIAAALYRGVCKLDDTSRWFSVQAPWNGSRVANVLDEVCKYRISFIHPGLISYDILLNFLKLTKYCTWSGTAAPAFRTLKTNYVSDDGISFSDLVSVARKNASGGICGDSSWGMGKKWLYSAAFFGLEHYANLPKPNDGVVSYRDSCGIFEGFFRPDYTSAFYITVANHFEGTCRYGDIDWIPFWWDEVEEKYYPCRWYKNSFDI